MMYPCWALRWTTVTDSERSSSYPWRPCSPDIVVFEVGPRSSLFWLIVDWRPGNKHNYCFSGHSVFGYSLLLWNLLIAVHCCSQSQRVERRWDAAQCLLQTTDNYHSHWMSLRASSAFCRGTKRQICSLWENHPLGFSVLLNQSDWRP